MSVYDNFGKKHMRCLKKNGKTIWMPAPAQKHFVLKFLISMALGGFLALYNMGLNVAVTIAAPLSQSNPIVVENQNTGSTQWALSNQANDTAMQIKGYASATSVNKGGSINFHVTVTPAQTFEIDVYRMGWYGGTGGRLMQQIGPLNGVQQPPPVLDLTTGLITAPWSVSHTLTVPSSWTSGVYLAKLTNSNGYQNYIKFVVRDDSSTADLIYQHSDTTDQAYNKFPEDGVMGKNMYSGAGSNTVAGTPRAVKVSFDRPYSRNGAGFFFYWEYHMIRWLEKSGYDLKYMSNIDTHAIGGQLLNSKGFLSAGHDEYWSNDMFDFAEQARDAGTNLAFFGSNDVYWRVRFEPSASGVANRIMVCYKSYSVDPETVLTKETIRFRDSGRPEQTLIGVMYEAYDNNGHANYDDMIIQNSNHWVYANTGFTNGSTVPSIIGYEVDLLHSNHPAPVSQSYTTLSSSPFTAANGTTPIANSSIYQAPSNAWVFGAGTMNWSYALDKSGYVDARIQQTTANILDEFVGSVSSATATPTPTVPATATLPPTATPTPTSTSIPTLTPIPTPVAPGQLAPNSTTSSTPQFEWNPVANASTYTVAVYDVIADSVPFLGNFANTICTATLCSTQIGTSLTPSDYTWLVRGINSAGIPGPWSVYGSSTATPTPTSVASTSTPTPTPTPPPSGGCGGLVQEAESGTLSGAFAVGSDSAASGGQYIDTPWTSAYQSTLNPAHKAEYCFTVTQAGNYRIKVDVSSDRTASDNSMFMQIDGLPANGYLWDMGVVNPASPTYAFDYVNDDGVADPVVVNLSAGNHTVTFFQRERHARIDKIELEPAVVAASASVNSAVETTSTQPSGESIYGHLLLEDNAERTSISLAGYIVTIIDVESRGKTLTKQTVTDESGRYEITGLALNNYIVQMQDPSGELLILQPYQKAATQKSHAVRISFDAIVMPQE